MRLLAVFIFGVLLLDLFSLPEAGRRYNWSWRRRRARRPRPRPPPPPPCHIPSTTKAKWFNLWDQPFTFECPSGQAITEIHSLYSSCHRDRVFRFACRTNIAANGRCHWSHYVNNWDEVVAFKCPYSGFVTGISSYHHDGYEDRRFKFRCCTDHRYLRFRCSYGSHFLNGWRKPLNLTAAHDHFLVGAISYHDNGQEDRRWKFETCKVARNTLGRRSCQRKKLKLN